MKNKIIGDLPADELSIILGYEPGREQILEMLNYAKEKGEPLGKVARDRSMPPLFEDWDHSGFITTKDAGRIKIEDYQKLHPWLRLIILSTKNKNTDIE